MKTLIPGLLLGLLAGTAATWFYLVEVAPPFDQSGNTAHLAANILFEILCVMTGGN